jgi:hypothetical protein
MMNNAQIKNNIDELQLLTDLIDWVVQNNALRLAEPGRVPVPAPKMDRAWFDALAELSVETFVDRIVARMKEKLGDIPQARKMTLLCGIAPLLICHSDSYIDCDLRIPRFAYCCYKTAKEWADTVTDPAILSENMRREIRKNYNMAGMIGNWLHMASLIKKDERGPEYDDRIMRFKGLFSHPSPGTQRMLRRTLSLIFSILPRNENSLVQVRFQRMLDIFRQTGDLLQECNPTLLNDHIRPNITRLQESSDRVCKETKETLQAVQEMWAFDDFLACPACDYVVSETLKNHSELIGELLNWQEILAWGPSLRGLPLTSNSEKRKREDDSADIAETDAKRPRLGGSSSSSG